MDENREIEERNLEKVAGGGFDVVERTYRCHNCGGTKTILLESFCEAGPIPCPYCKLPSGQTAFMSLVTD